MNPNSAGISQRLLALRRREAALREAIAIERVRHQKRTQRDEVVIHTAMGRALAQEAAKHPDFEMMLKSILKSTTSFTDTEVKLLRAKAWL